MKIAEPLLLALCSVGILFLYKYAIWRFASYLTQTCQLEAFNGIYGCAEDTMQTISDTSHLVDQEQ